MLLVTGDVGKNWDEEILALALDILRSGGVIAYATDTCYGLSCDATSASAVTRLRRLKKLPNEKPISLFFSDLEMFRDWTDPEASALALAQRYWPGDLTLIVPKKADSEDCANRAFGTVGCRVPDCEFSRSLVRELARPLTSTSANISGLPQTYSGVDLIEQFATQELKPDLLIDSGLRPRRLPSTILDLTVAKNRRLVRQGDLILDLSFEPAL